MRRVLLPVILFAFTFWQIHAGAPAAREARLLRDLQFLTSDACEGRGITTKGIELAATHIEREMIKAGLLPGGPDQSYFQPFTVASDGKLGKDNQLVLRGPLKQTLTLEHGKHFVSMLQGGSGKIEAPLVFVGYGLTTAQPAYDDYALVDVAGKIVVVFADTPRKGHPFADLFAEAIDPGSNPYSLRARAENALKHKAVGMLVVNTRARAKTQDALVKPSLLAAEGAPWGLPVAQVQRDLVDAMLRSFAGGTLSELEGAIDADLKPRSFPLPWTCRLHTDLSYTQAKVKNVVGIAPGSGPLANETIVIGAHYDHVGLYGTTRRFPTTAKGVSGPGSIGGVGLPLALVGEAGIHHGADDNASGTSIMLELGRHFAAQKERQGRRIVFVAFSAEESGLIGSDYYCRHPAYPLQDTVAMINMDQVGRLQDDKLLVGGVGTAKTFAPLLDKHNARHGFKLVKELSGIAPSDNTPFYARRIPVFWFFTGFHEQYHRPTDRVETLNVPGMAKLAGYIADVAAALAESAERPVYAKTGGFDRTKTLWAFAPSTGIVPDYHDKGAGVLVEHVFKGTAGAQSGVKKGDRILAVAGQKVANSFGFVTLSRTLKPGEKVPLVLTREGQEQTLVLQLALPPKGLIDPYCGFAVDLNDLKGGLLITEVLAGSAAAKAGIQKGDRIIAANGQPISDRDAYFAVFRALKPGATVPLILRRGGKTVQVKVTLAAT